MSRVKIFLGNFSRSVSREALVRRSTLIIDDSVPLPEYQVRSCVRPETLNQFLAWIEDQAEINIRAANVYDFSSLSEEFGVLELITRCDIFSSSPVTVSNVQISNQPIEAISNRIGRLEERISLSVADRTNLRNDIEQLRRDYDGQLVQMTLNSADENLALSNRIESVERNAAVLRPQFELLQTHMNTARETLSHVGLEFPLKVTRSLTGIISYLTQKHSGNVQDKNVVAITSMSVEAMNPAPAAREGGWRNWFPFGDRNAPVRDPVLCHPRNVADLTSDSYFSSKDEPWQWICWDFGNLCARPTHYTIKSDRLKSWVLEGSLDGENWVEIDRQTGNCDWNPSASFAVSKAAECRFIRLTQTGKNRNVADDLRLQAVEFFGTVLECQV